MSMGEIGRRVRHLPLMLVASAVLAVLAAIAGGIALGGVGALGAVAGVALVTASFTVSSLIIAWADSINPALVLPVGLLTYALKILVLGLVLFGMVADDWAGRVPLGLGVIAAVLLWTTLQAWWTWRAKIPYVDV